MLWAPAGRQGGLGGGLIPDLTEELVLQGHNPVLGGEDGVLQVLQLLADVPLGVDGGLLPGQSGARAGSWDLATSIVVAEHLVELDSQVF